MSQTAINTNQEWLKILGKGMVTIPKQWRDELGLEEGMVVKAKKEGNKVVIEAQESNPAAYRIYTNSEIEEFVKEDKLPQELSEKIRKNLARVS